MDVWKQTSNEPFSFGLCVSYCKHGVNTKIPLKFYKWNQISEKHPFSLRETCEKIK